MAAGAHGFGVPVSRRRGVGARPAVAGERRLTNLCGMTLATPEHPEMHGAMTAFRLLPRYDPMELRRGLWEKWRIEAPVIERPEGLLIRASTHFYNTEEEVDRLAEALADF